ncbi:PP2C family protein-serine/threonine phosphatase [Curtobacterium sp. MCBD17_019]|uniref:PP2C family protein-serine/threonine phosphatase n=1 Tax=Curtobacterium sp. MCBD17_019 TaxID=2175669 RepID=UPI000DAA64E9|nr:SpoIIE family protein phosphatase [Curtobacterium sp. MCBD17_019]PZE76537.1 serine/threonine protein phosphatase [Curtobacterium sp. MCBD17_019]
MGTQPTLDDATTDQPRVREDRRQRAVESLGLTEPDRNPRLDRITRIARALFGVMMSSVTVIDRDRALYMGRAGFDDAESGRGDTPCKLVTDTGEVITTDDARLDPRFADIRPFVENGLAFYIGHPLTDASGNVVGSFCLIDKEPRTLSPREMQEFTDLAAWAQEELLAEAEAVRARDTQQALLPERPLVTDEVRVEGVCIPSLGVGGDYYDHGVVGRLVHVAIGDVMGKGTAAAILGAATRAAARTIVPSITDEVSLGAAVDRIERAMTGDLQRTNAFVTYFHATIDLDTGRLAYVDAGAGLSILVRADGTAEQLTGTGLPIGILPQPHTAQTTTLYPGDRLVLVSDGVLDVLDDEIVWPDELAGYTREAADIHALVERIRSLSAERVPLDDVTVVVAEYRP